MAHAHGSAPRGAPIGEQPLQAVPATPDRPAGSATSAKPAGSATPSRLDSTGRPDRWRRLFRGQEGELRQLRHWIAGLLPDRPARDDLISVAVELGTNAIQHTASGNGGWFSVEVAGPGPVVRVAVTDEGAPGGPCVSDDPMSDCGRGLVIVRALSLSSGVSGDQRGRTVWAEIAWAPEAAAPPAAPVPGYPAVNGHRLHPVPPRTVPPCTGPPGIAQSAG